MHIFTLIVILAQVASTLADPCALFSQNPIYATAKDCLQSFPFNQARHQTIVDNLLKALNFHVFVDISNASPDPDLQPNYNLRGELFKLKSATFPNDMAAQEALATVFMRMNDAHSTYDPLCYRKIAFVQHFFPIALADKISGKTRIFVGGLPSPPNKQDEGYVGREILQIDGKDAFQVLWGHAQTQVGRYKDASARFGDVLANMSFDDKSGWVLNAGSWASRARLPPTDVVSFTFAAGNGRPQETVVRPWFVNKPKEAFNSGTAYWDAFCKANAKANKDQEMEGAGKAKAKASGQQQQFLAHQRPADNEDFLHNYKTDPDRKPLASFVLAVDKSQLPKPLIKYEGLAFFKHPKDPLIGILSINTFSIDGEKAKWRTTMAQIIQRFNTDKMKKLIVDLTGNGGGYLDLAWETIAVLTPNKQAPFPMIAKRFKRDVRLSPLHKAMIKRAHELKHTESSMNPAYYGEPNSKSAYKGLHLIEPGRKRPLSRNDPYLYSQLFQELPVNPKGNPLISLSFNLKPQDMVVLSSGDCGSACAMLYLHLREVDGVRGAALGYIANRPRMVSTFPITEVFTLQQLIKEITMLKLEGDKSAPKSLPVSAVFKFPIREGYSQRQDALNRVEEYLWSGADILIDNDARTMLRPDRVWMRLSSLLGWYQGKRVKKTIPYDTDPKRTFGTTPKDNLVLDVSKLINYSGAKGPVIEGQVVGAMLPA